MKFTAVTDRVAMWDLRKLTRYAVVLAVLIGLVSAFFWYTRVYMTPERRFWNAIDNSMATPSVVRTLTQGGSGNLVVQDYRFNYTPQRVIENTVDFTERSATVNTSIQTEGIITTSDQYLRYSGFSSDDGTNLDDLIGSWAKQAPAEGAEEQARLNYVSELVTLAVFGNFDANYRRDTADKLRGVYDVKYGEHTTYNKDGEQYYGYTVSVKLPEFAAVLQQAFVDAGYGEFPPLDPAGYREGSTISALFEVRTRDNTITGISFGGREESYSNYGVQKTVAIPETEQKIEDLQSRVQDAIETTRN